MTDFRRTPVGRPADEIRLAWTLRFSLTPRQSRDLNCLFMKQLSQCRSDEARRLLLGVGERYL